jgi:YaiO family outer membrane protein
MRRTAIILFTGILVSLLSGSAFVYSQENVNPEEQYAKIRTLAFSGDYAAAVDSARKLLKAYPSYGDVRILLGRVLAWQKKYDEAAAVIDTLLKTDPTNADALSARKDITLWSKVNTPVSTDARVGYYFDYFNEPYYRLWQVFSAGVGHRFKFGPAAAYLNVGNLAQHDPLPGATEYQIEAEAYPKLSSSNYAFLSYAYSPGPYFPKHRGTVEIWQILPKGFEVAAGLNYYYFDRSVYIGIVSLEKYIKKFWLSGTCYVYFKDEGPTTSFYLNVRRYFNDFNYLQLTLGTGTAPDEPFDIHEDILRLKANSVRIAYNTKIVNRLMLRVGAGYSREKYAESLSRDRYEGSVNLIYAISMK